MTEPQTTLTEAQQSVLIDMIYVLDQLVDREQMNAAAYLAKYKNKPSVEDIVVLVKWKIQSEFPL